MPTIVTTLNLGSTNSYLLKAKNGYLLIDTSLPEYAKAFQGRLEKVNVKLSEINYLLITHSHDDHAGFAAEIKEKTGCMIITHRNAVESLKQGTIINVGQFLNRQAHLTMSLYNLAKRRTFEYSPLILTDNDVIISEDNDEVLRKIGIDGKIICTPGHTDDCISVILDNGDAFVSDACMSNLGFLHYRPIEVSNLKQVFESWQKIIDNGAKTIYPSHGKPFPVEKLIFFKEKYAPSSL
jgi:glyoxylase-like metal-dependent hydrolase (beta-lactamase superfamily II)